MVFAMGSVIGQFCNSLLLYIILSEKVFAVDYFPKGYFNSSDVTKITWAHGVNSKASLTASIQDTAIQMLEADLVIGTIQGSSDNRTTVIMAHPPANMSDLSFATFLDTVIQHNRNISLAARKGIKLDFKEYEAARQAIPMIMERRQNDSEQVMFPIWINADILPGPINASQNQVDGRDLIFLQKQNAPDSTLSIGWTTRFGKQSDGEILTNGSYTRENMDQMASLIREEYPWNNIVEITFPLRAGLALNSLENIKYLLDGSGINHTSPSITLWEGASDPPLNLTELDAFINTINKSRVFVDLPYSLGNNKSTGWAVKSETKSIAILLLLVVSWSTFN